MERLLRRFGRRGTEDGIDDAIQGVLKRTEKHSTSDLRLYRALSDLTATEIVAVRDEILAPLQSHQLPFFFIRHSSVLEECVSLLNKTQLFSERDRYLNYLSSIMLSVDAVLPRENPNHIASSATFFDLGVHFTLNAMQQSRAEMPEMSQSDKDAILQREMNRYLSVLEQIQQDLDEYLRNER